MPPLVSIIIPTYNRAHLIGETLESILAQTYSNWECIIVDDGSTDDSVAVIQKFIDSDSRFQYRHRPTNRIKGPSSCRNVGIENASGDYLMFLDSDDFLTENCLNNRTCFAEANSDCDFWIFNSNRIDQHGRVMKFNKLLNRYDEEEYVEFFFKDKIPFCITAPLWRPHVLKAVDGFDEQLAFFEDPDLHIRILEEGFKQRTDIYSESDHKYFVSTDKVSAFQSNPALIFNNYLYFINKYIDRKTDLLKPFIIKFFKSALIHLDQEHSIKVFKLMKKHNLLSFKENHCARLLIYYQVFKLQKKKD